MVAEQQTDIPRFVLTIARDDRGGVRISASGPAGEVTAEASLPLPWRGPFAVGDLDEARHHGGDLHAFAFPPAIEALLEESRYRAGESPIVVVLAVDDEFAPILWELLFDPEVERFLALSPGTPLVRSETKVPPAAAPEHANLRVRMVAPTITSG
jgi:hypothetical protein